MNQIIFTLKTLIRFVLALLCLFVSAQGTSATDSVMHNEEWSSLVAQLEPLGERILDLLEDPQDRQLRHEMYQMLYAEIAHGYLGLVYEDVNHPEFWPYFNQAFNIVLPNPDDTYYVAPIQGDGVYRIVGHRGSVRIVDIQVATGDMVPRGTGVIGATLANYNLDRDVHTKNDGSFEVLLSHDRPLRYAGDWWPLDLRATHVLIRQVAYDWMHEVDGRFAIIRLDRPAIKPRPSAEQIDENLKQIPIWAAAWTEVSIAWINKVRRDGFINKLRLRKLGDAGGLSTQTYVEGLFELGPNEALILESEVPKHCRYWNFQLSDELWRTLDPANRQTTLNGHTARLDSDGKFRAVISAQDPRAPNWLDTAGYKRGGVYGRWDTCDSYPLPTVRKIQFADVHKYLPADTPSVDPAQRAAAIRLRSEGVQMRRKW